MFIDTHCHLEMKDFSSDLEEVITQAYQNDVKKIITIGCSLKSAYQTIEIIKKYKNVYGAIGLHPSETESLIQNNEKLMEILEQIEELAKNDKVVAVGEIGLDYRGLVTNNQSKQNQKEVFLRQLSIAHRLRKPIMIHCRQAYEDLIKILTEYLKFQPIGHNLSGVIHCFSGRLIQAKKLLELGFYISFTGVISYARDYDKVIKEIPLERLLLETDAPFLAPIPYRGKRNEPAYVSKIAQKIAEIKKISLEEVAEKTTANALALFKFN